MKFQRNPRDRPAQILKAALKRFGDTGVEGTTLDEIAEEAGVSKGTVYLYFESKDALLREVIRDGVTPGFSAQDAQPEATPSDQLRDSIERFWRLLRLPSTVIAQKLVAEAWRIPELSGLYNAAVIIPFQTTVEKTVQAGVDSGEFREVGAGLTAEMFTGLVTQLASQQTPGTRAHDPVPELVDFCLQILAPTDTAFAQADGAPTFRGALNN